MNKRGGLGSIISTFVATILVIIILVVFVLLSGLVKMFGEVSGETKIYGEDEIGLSDMRSYMNSYQVVLDNRFNNYVRENSLGGENG